MQSAVHRGKAPPSQGPQSPLARSPAGHRQPTPARNAAGPCCLQPQPREPAISAAGLCRSAPQGERRSRAPRGSWGTRGSRPEREISHAAAHSHQRLQALRRLPVQSIHAFPLEGQKPSPGMGGGSGMVSARCQTRLGSRAAAAGTSAQPGEAETEIQPSPSSPQPLPAGGCNKSRTRLGRPLQQPPCEPRPRAHPVAAAALV